MAQFPIDTVPVAVLPLLVEAKGELKRLAAPEASWLVDEIDDVLERLIAIGGSVEAYGNKWCSGRVGALANELRAAIAPWYC